VRLTGALREGTLATDLALTLTHRLRELGVSGAFVEYFGPGVASLGVGQRAVVANMAPEYGATTGCFPIDGETLAFLRDTGRPAADIALVETYARANALWFEPDNAPRYTSVLEVDLAAIGPTLAGPRRPQDRLDAAEVAAALSIADAAAGIPPAPVAIAALTSCTNTTDFALLAAAGLLAGKARRLGLRPPAWVKISLTPGSPAARRRLERAGLIGDLEALGFAVAGYGCATCIGNSGPLLPAMTAAIARGATPIAVLSGNRNFPGRVHAAVEQALLASPPLVVAYALAGHARLDITRDALAATPDGRPVHLAELWPTQAEVATAVAAGTVASDVVEAYDAAEASAPWAALEAPGGARFPWEPHSTYLRRPPFVGFAPAAGEAGDLLAHPLLVLGDDVTTDHISPAGAIPPASDAGVWLTGRGEDPADLNVYAARRGNWEVMLRGLFTNRTVVNLLAPGLRAGATVFAPTGERLPAWQAARRYADAGLAVVLLAGERYGTGSSRDWAAKGAQLLGVRAVLANSFERIHRANLVCMGVLPLRMPPEWSPDALALRPGDTLAIGWDLAALSPRGDVAVTLRRATGALTHGQATALLDTAREVALIRAGGIIPMILARALAASRNALSEGDGNGRSR
jgi:aconitate hydratase